VPSLWEAFLAAEPGTPRLIDGAALDEAFAAIADFADLKSRYTRGHSSGVAALAEAAARTLGLDDTTVRDLRRAALVHDLGRVAVSAGVWDKLAPLTDAERERIRVHTRIPERVLARAPALAPIATLATLAHEHLDGNEYPRLQQPATAYADAAHVLAAADVYRALTEERPHRPALGHADAAAELTRMVEAGRLSADAAGAVIAAAGHGVPRVEAPAGFSDRDIEVLRLIARGLTDKEIASALHVDARSAGHEVEHVLAKLDVTTRAAAAMRAMQLGVVA